MLRTVDPAGTRWRVRRRWRADELGGDSHLGRWWRRTGEGLRRTRAGEWVELAHIGELGEIPVIGVVFLVIALVVLAAVAVLFVVPALIAFAELVVLLLVGAGGVAAKVVFRHPWVVEARAADGQRHQWPVVGWRASGAARRFVAEALAATGRPPSPEAVAAVGAG